MLLQLHMHFAVEYSAGLALFVGFVGCSSPHQASQSHDNGGAPSITLEPLDLTTDHDAADVRIAAHEYFHGPATLTAADLTLRAHPSGNVVAASFAAEVGTESSIVAHPETPLDPGWYALVVEGDATGAVFPKTHERTDGAFEARFRIGSEPLLVAIHACDKEDGSSTLQLEFSELVQLPGGNLALQVLADASPAACSVYMPPSPDGIGLRCTPALPSNAAISVEIQPGITSSSSGLPLASSAGPLPRTFTLAANAEVDTCRHWRETASPVD